MSCFGRCPAVVPCATVDEESGSNLKLGSCVDHPTRLQKNCFTKNHFQNKPLHVLKLALLQMNLSLSLDISCAHALYPSPWRRLDLLSTFVLTPIYMLLLQRKTWTSWLKTSSRGCVRTQRCLWCWPFVGCFHWQYTLSPTRTSS